MDNFVNLSIIIYDFQFSRYRKELTNHGIKSLETELLPDVDLKLPKLNGKNIEEHFYNIAKDQVRDYELLVKTIVKSPIPPMPKVSLSSHLHFRPYKTT